MPRTDSPPAEALRTLEAAYVEQEQSIARLLPGTVDPARFRELTLRELARDPKLLRCTPKSVMRAVVDMAKLGLEPVLGEAYLVPFWSSNDSAFNATMIIGYPGMQTLAYNSGLVTLIEGDVVYEHDEWTYVRGFPESTLRHVRGVGDRGEAIGAWAMVWLRGSERPLMDFLPESRIEQARKVSKSGTDRDSGNAVGIWREWRDEMRLKTALRHVLKLAPRSVRAVVGPALEAEDRVDSMLADAPVAPALTAGAQRRRDSVVGALADGATEPDPEEAETREVPEGDAPLETTESGAPAEVAPTSTPEAAAATGPNADDEAAVVAAAGVASCGAQDPYDGTEACYLAPGHPGSHRSAGASW